MVMWKIKCLLKICCTAPSLEFIPIFSGGKEKEDEAGDNLGKAQ
jgi:hypothetical protein